MEAVPGVVIRMGRPIHAILVDDEPGCLSNLQHYLETYCPDIRIAGTAADFDAAQALIASEPFDIAFLDVQLFDRTSFELLPADGNPPFPVVFVTAYENYAISAFRVSALDYLVKPLERDEVLRCYNKVVRYFETAAAPVVKSHKMLLRQGDRVYATTGDQLLFLQAQGFYTNVCFMHEGKIREVMVSKPINVVHQDWDSPDLMRVHRSYVINLKQVRSFKRNGTNLSLQLADRLIPVAKRRAAEFLDKYDG